jgi:putative protease
MEHSTCRAPELLAPAGDWDALRAAAANGADAVYFGLPQFNARHRATNFAPDELPKIMAFLHARNVKGYVTLNTLVFSDELPAVAEYVKGIAAAGADAVIVQDLGLVRLIKRLAPGLPVHGSTQMTLTEPRGVAFAKKLGVELVVLARELSLDDIKKVTAATDVPVEVFVHGALCVAYSGQCLTSEALGGRSANRGQCAQACRLPYEMIVDGTPRDLGDRAYLLSPQDLAAHDLVGDLADAGVASLKIEGRLKTAAYVAATTQTYRAALDAAAARRAFTLPAKERRDLAMTFSRGFTPGFLRGVDHQKLVQGRVPKSRGVRLGRVVAVSRRGARIELAEGDATLIKAGDGVVFDLGKPEQDEPGGRVWEVRFTPPRTAELIFEPGSFDPATVPPGCTVWKTDDPALRKRLEQSFATDRPAHRIPVTVTVTGRVGGPLRIALSDDAGHSATAEWPGPLEAARKHPLTPEAVAEQFGRLGDTPFELANVTADLPEPVMVPKSILNDLRRQAVTRLTELREPRYAIAEPDALEALRAAVPAGRSRNGEAPALTVLVRTLEQLDTALAARPALVYCDFEDGRRYREAVPRARAAGVPIGLATLRVLKPGEEGFLKPILSAAPDAVLVRNLAALDFFRTELPSATLIGDFSLNVANELTADLFIREGLTRLVPSYDLNWDQLAALLRRSDPAWYEPVVHQHMPMFHNEFCTYANALSEGKDFRDCGRPCDRHKIELKDRTGALFPVVADAGCRNTVYNSLPQSGAEYVRRMLELGVRRFRIDMLRETPAEVEKLLAKYARVVADLDDGRTVWRELRAMNQLGVTRGTLSLV